MPWSAPALRWSRSSAWAGWSTPVWSPAARTSGCWPPPPLPPVYWLLGGADPAAFAGAATAEQLLRVVAGLPSNHSPEFAPVEDPTLRVGVEALVAAATAWLSP